MRVFIKWRVENHRSLCVLFYTCSSTRWTQCVVRSMHFLITCIPCPWLYGQTSCFSTIIQDIIFIPSCDGFSRALSLSELTNTFPQLIRRLQAWQMTSSTKMEGCYSAVIQWRTTKLWMILFFSIESKSGAWSSFISTGRRKGESYWKVKGGTGATTVTLWLSCPWSSPVIVPLIFLLYNPRVVVSKTS